MEELSATDDRDELGGSLRGTYRDLCDRLLWSALTKNALRSLPHDFYFCDASGDSGHWSFRVVDECSGAHGVVLCESAQAFGDAATKKSRSNHGNRLNIAVAQLPDVAERSFDLTFSLHDVLALSEQPSTVLRQLVRITKPGGFVAVLAPNLYHAISFNLAHARVREAERALTGRASLPGRPQLNLFTPRSLEQMVMRAGGHPHATLGFPCSVQPRGPESDCGATLADVESHRTIQSIEEALLDSALAVRGSDLLSIAVMPPSAPRWGDYWLPDQ